MDSMNKYFGGQLRREFVELVSADSTLLRNRVQSTGSQRLSSDSTNSQEITLIPDINPDILDSINQLNFNDSDLDNDTKATSS